MVQPIRMSPLVPKEGLMGSGYQPKLKYTLLAAVCRVTTDWLLTGSGRMGLVDYPDATPLS